MRIFWSCLLSYTCPPCGRCGGQRAERGVLIARLQRGPTAFLSELCDRRCRDTCWTSVTTKDMRRTIAPARDWCLPCNDKAAARHPRAAADTELASQAQAGCCSRVESFATTTPRPKRGRCSARFRPARDAVQVSSHSMPHPAASPEVAEHTSVVASGGSGRNAS